MKTKTVKIVAILAIISCIAALAPAVSADCDHRITVQAFECLNTTNTPAYWYYSSNGTWEYVPVNPVALFRLYDAFDNQQYYGFCIDYEVLINVTDLFNATIIKATPSCKNNSLAYLLNHWIFAPGNCANVTAGQSAVWYFTYLKEDVCSLANPQFNHTAVPFVESRWIPDCANHSLACTMINNSINQSEPYQLDIAAANGPSYPTGTEVTLTATVTYCLETPGEEVTVEFTTTNGTFKETGATTYSNTTTGGKLTATLICNDEGEAVVTAEIKDHKWFEIVNPIGCQATDYQPTLRIVPVLNEIRLTFQEIKTGCLEGYIYEDRSCNCAYEPGEPGVQGMTVELFNGSSASGTPFKTTTTNASGRFSFCGLEPGVYTVRYDTSTLPTPLLPKCDDIVDYTYPCVGSETVPEGGTATHNFGVTVETGVSIEKRVNGVKNYEAEPGEEVTITLTITNTGKANLTNLKVDDQFPIKMANRGLTLVSGSANPEIDAALSSISPQGWIDFDIHWWGNDTYPGHLLPFEPLQPGQSFIISFNVTVDPDACGWLKDVAYVSALHEWCTSPCTDEDEAYVYVACEKFPVMTPIGIVALVGLLSLVIVLSTRKREETRGK